MYHGGKLKIDIIYKAKKVVQILGTAMEERRQPFHHLLETASFVRYVVIDSRSATISKAGIIHFFNAQLGGIGDAPPGISSRYEHYLSING